MDSQRVNQNGVSTLTVIEKVGVLTSYVLQTGLTTFTKPPVN